MRALTLALVLLVPAVAHAKPQPPTLWQSLFKGPSPAQKLQRAEKAVRSLEHAATFSRGALVSRDAPIAEMHHTLDAFHVAYKAVEKLDGKGYNGLVARMNAATSHIGEVHSLRPIFMKGASRAFVRKLDRTVELRAKLGAQ